MGAARGGGLGPDPAEGERGEHRLGEQHVAGAATAVVELEAPQRPPQSAQQHGIRTADRGGEHVDDVGRVELLGTGDDVEGAAQQGQERAHRRLVAHRQVGGRGVDRHPGAAQHPAQGGRAPTPAHDDGHPGPRHALEEVRLAQPPGDVAGLLGRGAQQVGLDVAAVGCCDHLAVRGATHDPDVRRHPARGGQHRAPAPVRRRQHPGRGVRPGRDEQARVGAAEGLGGGIRVAEQHELDTAPDDDLQQAQRGRA